MKVKQFISILSADTCYKIFDSDNPHNLIWFGRGNNYNIVCKENEILSIQWNKKGLIIYI